MEAMYRNLGKIVLTCDGEWCERPYDKLCLVYDKYKASYISKRPVPTGVPLNDLNFWQPVAQLDKMLLADYDTFKDSMYHFLNGMKEFDNIKDMITVMIKKSVPNLKQFVRFDDVVTQLKNGVMTPTLLNWLQDAKVFVNKVKSGAIDIYGTEVVSGITIRLYDYTDAVAFGEGYTIPYASLTNAGVISISDKRKLDAIILSDDGTLVCGCDLSKYVTFDDVATQTKNGAMSAADKIKLDGLEQVDLNSITLKGLGGISELSVTPQTPIKFTFSKNDTSGVLTYTIETASKTVNGFMSSTDKSRLDTLWGAYEDGTLGGNSGLTSSEVTNMINNALSSYATQSWVTTQINSALENYVTKDKFATINGKSIIEGGDITITSGSGTVDLSDYVLKSDLTNSDNWILQEGKGEENVDGYETGMYVEYDDKKLFFIPFASEYSYGFVTSEDKVYLDMLKKYIAETNSSGKQLVPISDLAKFFGEYYNDNAGLWNGDSSKSAANFYIYDFDGESKLFNGEPFRISLASSSYAGVMSATDKTHLDDLWTAYQSGALGGGGDINLSAYASKDLLVDWLKALANDGYYISWHHVAGDRSLNFHTAYITDADGGITSVVRNQLNFPVVESDDIINIKVLTSAEYSALGTKDSNTMYCITD